jgi:hypothetical protein
MPDNPSVDELIGSFPNDFLPTINGNPTFKDIYLFHWLLNKKPCPSSSIMEDNYIDILVCLRPMSNTMLWPLERHMPQWQTRAGPPRAIPNNATARAADNINRVHAEAHQILRIDHNAGEALQICGCS